MMQATHTKFGIRKHIVAGLLIVLLLVVGVAGMAGATLLSGAVIAHGMLAVTSNVKQVQHLEGGIVSEINVREGDLVEAGDVVIRLDPVVARSSLAIIQKDMDQNAARLARLDAERDDRPIISFPDDLTARTGSDAEVRDMLAGERNLFEARRVARSGQIAQLRERGEQLGQEIGGLAAQADAKSKEIGFIKQELEGTRQLWAKQLIPIQRVTILERDAVRIEGERGALIASVARARASIAETGLQILQVDQDLKSEVSRDTRDVQVSLSGLAVRRIAAQETLRRTDIRAPQAGIVHKLAVQTVGGVISSGSTLMHIVPVEDALRIDARVASDQVEQVFAGQDAVVHFSSFDRATTPEIRARVSMVSPDLTTDEKTGASYYLIHVDLAEEELKLLQVKLMPGMPAECFIRTADRTILSYVTKPLMDQVGRSFRD
jgi:HlyD family secretion protein